MNDLTPKGLTLKAAGNTAKTIGVTMAGMALESFIDKKVNKTSLMYHGIKTGALVVIQFVPIIPKMFKGALLGAALSSAIKTVSAITAPGGKLPESVASVVRNFTPTLAGVDSVNDVPSVASIYANQAITQKSYMPTPQMNGIQESFFNYG
jgi:hypothetical protein